MKQSVEKSVYDYLYETIERNGFPPTLEEMAIECDLEDLLLTQSLKRLEHEGYITCIPNKPGAIRIPELDWRWYREDQITQFIQTYLEKYQTRPSPSEIAKGCGLSATVVSEYLAHQQVEFEAVHLNRSPLRATA